jgi:hypothetical protein
MTLFEQIVADIFLVEDVNPGHINDAIDRTYEVLINYESDDDKASGERIIQPVAYGLTKAGIPVIRAYQPSGDTQTQVPAWKMFLVSGIQSWKPMRRQIFRTPPPGFNPNGDKSMIQTYNIAQFGNTPQEKAVQKPEPKVGSGPVTKDGTQGTQHISVKDNPEVKKLEKLRKQLDNPRYISDIVKDKTFGTEPQEQEQEEPPVMTAGSGPVPKETFKTQTEKDIESRRAQMMKGERVSQDVLDQWQKEQEKRKNRYGSNRNGIK